MSVLDCMRSQIDKLFNMIDDLKVRLFPRSWVFKRSIIWNWIFFFKEEFQKNIDDETEEMQTRNKKIKIDNEESTGNTETNNVLITDS